MTFNLAGVAEANPMREFTMSCTYGVLAGTLVGAATLAFTDQPGDNLNKVARGASLGLYAGILLGLYVVYMVPSNQETPEMYQQPGDEDLFPYDVRNQPVRFPKISLYPTFNDLAQIDGAGASWQVLDF